MMEQELSEQGDGGSANSDSEEEEGPIYNPKNLPLGIISLYFRLGWKTYSLLVIQVTWARNRIQM